MLGALGLFALGSALCGAAQSMAWLIAARSKFYVSVFGGRSLISLIAIQGAGGGGIQSLTGIMHSSPSRGARRECIEPSVIEKQSGSEEGVWVTNTLHVESSKRRASNPQPRPPRIKCR